MPRLECVAFATSLLIFPIFEQNKAKITHIICQSQSYSFRENVGNVHTGCKLGISFFQSEHQTANHFYVKKKKKKHLVDYKAHRNLGAFLADACRNNRSCRSYVQEGHY